MNPEGCLCRMILGMKTADSSMAALAPPGAGIPFIERIIARRVLLPLARLRTKWEDVPDLMDVQAGELVRVLLSIPESDRARPVLIRRRPGLEDSSRHWSAYMVFEHLRLVNARMVEIVLSLTTGSPLPSGPDRIEQFKPAPMSGPASLDGYRRTLADFRRAVLSAGPSGRASRATVPHPWFGPLIVSQWVPFTAMHQSIHLGQLRAIANGLMRQDQTGGR